MVPITNQSHAGAGLLLGAEARRLGAALRRAKSLLMLIGNLLVRKGCAIVMVIGGGVTHPELMWLVWAFKVNQALL